ncbi:hypothetical protein ACFY41_29675 [Streptomyces syringium]
MQLTTQTAEEYIAPSLIVLGTVPAVTLGTAGDDDPDDTQYWK